MAAHEENRDDPNSVEPPAALDAVEGSDRQTAATLLAGLAASTLRESQLTTENAALRKELSVLHDWAEKQREHIDELAAWTKVQENQIAKLSSQLETALDLLRTLQDSGQTAPAIQPIHRMPGENNHFPLPLHSDPLPAGGSARFVFPTFQPRITVVLPVWNHSAFLEGSIRSVLSQTYSNLELIVVDDGSDEDLTPIFQRFIADPRLQVIRRPHEGLPRSLSAGFRRASGSFYTWTSADNVMHHDMIQRLAAFLVNHPGVEMAYADMDLIDDWGRPLMNSNYRARSQRPRSTNQLSLPRNTQTLGVYADNFIGGCFLYRAMAGRIAGDYDAALLGTEDYDYWIRILLLGSIEHLDSDDCLYSYRVHSDSLSGRHGPTVRANTFKLIDFHRERVSYAKERFDVLLIGDSESGPLAGAAEQIANALRTGRHSITRINSSGADPKHGAAIHAWMESAAANGRKSLAICFSPDHAPSIALHASPRQAVFLWMPPDGFSRPIESEHFNSVWFLCESGASVDQLPVAAERNWLHFPVSNPVTQDSRRLLAQSRGDGWAAADLPESTGLVFVYLGPSDDTYLSRDAVSCLGLANPGALLVLISTCEGVPGAPQDLPPNVHYLGYRDSASWSAYLSRADLLIAPLRHATGVERHAHDMMSVYLSAGKPILASEAVADAGYSDAPNTFFASAGEFPPAGGHALQIVPDLDLASRYLSRKSPDFIAARIVDVANTRLFYQQRRGNTAEVHPSNSSRRLSCVIETGSLHRGGLEQVVADMAAALHTRGDRVSIVLTGSGGACADLCRERGIAIHMTGGDPGDFRRILETERADILISHFSGAGSPLAWELGIPVLSFIHNCYVWTSRDQDREIARTDLFVSRYIAVSQSAKQYFCGKYHVDPGKVMTIPNGIDVRKFQRGMDVPPRVTRASLALSADDFVLLQAASFFAVKAQIHSISAVAALAEKCPGLKLVLIGSLSDPAYQSAIQAAIRDLGLAGRVLLLPTADNMADYYRLADAFVLPSLTEGWSLAMTEAMLFGLPLILTGVGGAREVIQEGDIGIVIPPPYRDIATVGASDLQELGSDRNPPNLPSLVAAMEEMYFNRNTWKQKAQTGISKVTGSFDYELIGARHAREIDRVVKRHAGPNGRALPAAYDGTASSTATVSPELPARAGEHYAALTGGSLEPGPVDRLLIRGGQVRRDASFAGNSLPLISCIMPTADRRAFVPRAIRQFLRQDYPGCELIILDSGQAPVDDLIPSNPRIHYMRTNPGLRLGTLRNLACRIATGEFIAHWDDDDWIASWRLSYQLQALIHTASDVCGIDRMFYWDPIRNQSWRYSYPRNERPWLAGGSLMYRRSLWEQQPFQEIDVGEDNVFVWSEAPKRMAHLDHEDFYIALLHSGNTSPKIIDPTRWIPIDPALIAAALGPDALECRELVIEHERSRRLNAVGRPPAGAAISQFCVAARRDLDLPEFVMVRRVYQLQGTLQWEIPFALYRAGLSDRMSILDCAISATCLGQAITALYPNVQYSRSNPLAGRDSGIEHNFPEQTFDRVFCLDTLEHLAPSRRELLILNLAASLKPGGRLILTSPYYPDSGKPAGGSKGISPRKMEEVCRRCGLIPLAAVPESSEIADPQLFFRQEPAHHAIIGGSFVKPPLVETPVRRIVLALLTWNTRQISLESVTALCAEAQMLRRVGQEAMICVVDNGSDDGTAEELRKVDAALDLPHRFILNRENVGNSRARNQMIDYVMESGADYIVFLDGDIEIVPCSSFAMLCHMESRGPTIGCLGAFSAHFTAERTESTTALFSMAQCRIYRSDILAWTQYGMFRRELFESGIRFEDSGPFGGPGHGLEDVDFALQLHRNGYLNEYFEGICYLHRHLSSSVGLLRRSGVNPVEQYYQRKEFLLKKWDGDQGVSEEALRWLRDARAPWPEDAVTPVNAG